MLCLRSWMEPHHPAQPMPGPTHLSPDPAQPRPGPAHSGLLTPPSQGPAPPTHLDDTVASDLFFQLREGPGGKGGLSEECFCGGSRGRLRGLGPGQDRAGTGEGGLTSRSGVGVLTIQDDPHGPEVHARVILPLAHHLGGHVERGSPEHVLLGPGAHVLREAEICGWRPGH